MNNQEKGLLYEKFIKSIIINNLGKNAYLWNECPENILIENNLIHSHNDMRLLRKYFKEGQIHNHKDIGIDLIQINKDNISIIQAKNGYENGLCVNDISGIMMRSAFSRISTFIYYTSNLSRNIKYTSKNSSYVFDIDCNDDIDKLLEIPEDNNIYFVKLPYKNIEIAKPIIKYNPFSYQIEAFEKIDNNFKKNNRGILSLPCGCGKTYTSYLISNKFSQIIFISPLREFANQNLNKFIEYGYKKSKTLLIDTDGERDIDKIKEFIRKNKKFLISTTYKSVDMIIECLELFDNPLFIIDEFHNISKTNIIDENNDIYKLLHSKHKILFMSATPRIYDIEYDEEDYDVEQIFGEIVYDIKFRDAISNGYICDYKIWLPSIHENNDELNKELSIYDIDNNIKNRCLYLYSCILNNGSRKTIIYCKNTNDMNEMIECMKILNEYYMIDMDIYGLCCENNDKYRKFVLDKFSNTNDKIQLLFNIKILNECIDIPCCDSIYISYSSKNKITTIQRINRATRIDKNNPYKIANIYIWCNEYDEILETLSSIKEFDILFKERININSIDFYNNKTINDIEILKDDKKLIEEYVIGIKEYKIISWIDKLKMVEDYIIKYKILPSRSDKNNEIRSLGHFVKYNKRTYLNNIMIKSNIIIWENFIEKYEDLILLKYNIIIWNKKYELLRKYIKENNSIPKSKSNGLYKWIAHQKQYFKNNEGIMKNNDIIKKKWKDLIDEFPHLFITNMRLNNENWYIKFNNFKEFIIKNRILPSVITDKSLRRWYDTQQINYNEKKLLMEDEIIRKVWQQFLEEFKDILNSNRNEIIWIEKLNKTIDYIKEHNKLPTKSNNDNEIKMLGYWIGNQRTSYSNNINLLKVPKFRQMWEDFVKEYNYLL